MDVAASVPAVRRSEARAMHGAIAENRSVHKVHVDRRGGLPPGWRTSTELTPQSRKKCIFRSALKTFLLAVSALLLLNATQLQALSTDSRQQIEVEADSLEIRENDNISVYQGNVRLLQGSMQIDSDHMVIHFNDEGELESMVMTGSPARFRQLDDQNQQMLGQARKINYLESENILELIDEARFDRAGDVIESSLIRINTKTNGIAAGSDDPDQRVKVLIQPKLKN